MMKDSTKSGIANRTPKRHGINRISAMTKTLLKPMINRYGMAYVNILLDWPIIVGERYAELTAVQGLKFPMGKKTDGVLSLRCVSAAIPILQVSSPQIIERLNQYFGYRAIVNIRLQAGLIPKKTSKKQTTVDKPLSPQSHEKINTITNDVPNDELRIALQRLGECIFKEEESPKHIE